jgi:hypothetical protein
LLHPLQLALAPLLARLAKDRMSVHQVVMGAALLAGLLTPASAFAPLRAGAPARWASPGMPHHRVLAAAASRRAHALPAVRMELMAAVAQAAGSRNAFLCAAAGKAQAIESGTQLMVSKILGYGILVGSLFLQVPQLYKILKLRSVAGISRWSRYSEVPINTSSCIYHFLIGAPLSTWGENIIVLTQNVVIVMTCWYEPLSFALRAQKSKP